MSPAYLICVIHISLDSPELLQILLTLPYFTIVQIIFHSLWDHWTHYGTFENGYLYKLEVVSSVANFIAAYEIKWRLPFSDL